MPGSQEGRISSNAAAASLCADDGCRREYAVIFLRFRGR
jgi:hypothetical protein